MARATWESWEQGAGEPDAARLVGELGAPGAVDAQGPDAGWRAQVRDTLFGGSISDWTGALAIAILLVLTMRDVSPRELLRLVRQPAETQSSPRFDPAKQTGETRSP